MMSNTPTTFDSSNVVTAYAHTKYTSEETSDEYGQDTVTSYKVRKLSGPMSNSLLGEIIRYDLEVWEFIPAPDIFMDAHQVAELAIFMAGLVCGSVEESDDDIF